MGSSRRPQVDEPFKVRILHQDSDGNLSQANRKAWIDRRIQ